VAPDKGWFLLDGPFAGLAFAIPVTGVGQATFETSKDGLTVWYTFDHIDNGQHATKGFLCAKAVT